MKTDDFLKAEMNRRRFLGAGARNAAGMAAGVVTFQSPLIAGALAERIRVGVIGVRSQGKRLAVESARLPGVEVTALCDVDPSMLSRAADEVAQAQQRAPRQLEDYRQLCDDPSLDAVIIATPDHWHALMTVEACQAGKDVYVETPLAHTIGEGQVMLAAAGQQGRIVQCGLQQRSGTHFKSAIELVRSGRLGTVRLAKAWSVQQRQPIPVRIDQSLPAGVNHDLWQGPAKTRPFNESRFHYHWRWSWTYGMGELGNWGVHLLDLARWGLDVELPTRVAASGVSTATHDDDQTPDTLTVQYSFPVATIVWEHRLWSRHGIEGRPTGVAFYGDEGTLVVDRSGWKVYGSRDSLTADASELRVAHLRNFYDAVRTRQTPACDLRNGHLSSSLAHLGNISFRLGREVSFDPAREDFGGDAIANEFLRHDYRAPWTLPAV